MKTAKRVAALLLALAFSATAWAGWWEVYQADGNLDLATARRLALASVTEDPRSADAVASAMWWLANLDNLPAPEEILAAAEGERDPELGFALARIEAALVSRPPAGSLALAELVGPFGVFSVLDLERQVVPPDAELPPLGTPWRDPAHAFHVVVRSQDGVHGRPLAMAVDGVFLLAWSLSADRDVEGWLVIEADGGFNLEIDGRPVDRRRYCGSVDPGTNWYHLQLAEGFHRLRVEMASPGEPQVRASLLDDRGGPLEGVTVTLDPAAELAASEALVALPPASAALWQELEEGEHSEAGLELAAYLAQGRNDLQEERHWLETACTSFPGDPWAAFALANHLYWSDTDAQGSEAASRLTELLRQSTEIPMSLILERGLAVRENRGEDAENLLEELIEKHHGDVRVLRIWVREAVRQGWGLEAEEGLEELETALPDSRSVTALRLEVLAALERWRERAELLQVLAAMKPVESGWIRQLASSCLVDEATTAMEDLASRVEDPDFDVEVIHLLLDRGDSQKATAALDDAREQWGFLPVLDELELILASVDDETLDEALAEALRRDPANLQLLTLSWRRGAQPFFAPFRVDATEFASKHRKLGRDSDVVLLLDQAVERIFPDGSSVYYYHGVTRVNTPGGIRRASVLQPLPDSYFFKIRIIKPDGRVVVPAELSNGGDAIVLSEVEPGDLVEEEYVARVAATGASRKGHLPPYIYRFADPERAFGLSEYVLLVPPEVDLQVDGNFKGLETSEQDWQGLRMLRWAAEEVPPMPTEPFAPPAQDLLPWLNYGFGVTWQDVGDAVRDRILPVLRTSPELRAWAAPLLAADDPEQALHDLVDQLLETVEPGGGELAMGASAGESFARRRGNRLGIVAAVLDESGWNVDLVLTRVWTQRATRLDLPTLDAFPVAVLRVERDGEVVWIDIREGRRGVGHINPLFQGSDGLVLPLSDPQRQVSLLAKLPTFPNPDLEEAVTVRAKVAESGDARVSFHMPLRGTQAENLIKSVETVPEDQVAIVYRQMAASLFPGADDVEGGIERVSEGAVVDLEMTVPDGCEPDDGAFSCRALILANPLVPVLASLPERQYPLVLRLPLLRSLDLELTAPPGWRPAFDKPRQLTARWGSVTETVEEEGNVGRSVLHIEIPAQTVSPEEYPEFARFCQAVDELTTRPPRLVPSDE